MDGLGGLEGWRWIFILEGILTVIIAFLSYFVLSDFPETAKFLTTEERAWVVKRLRYQGSKDSGYLIAESEQFQWKYVRDAFTDWQVYLQVLGMISSTFDHALHTNSQIALWGVDCPLYGHGPLP